MTVIDMSDPALGDAKDAIARVVAVGSRPPELVFTRRYGRYSWLEYDFVLDDPFFLFLQELASRHLEAKFFVQCISPYPEVNFGHSGVAEFARGDAVADYDDFMEQPRTTSICVRYIADLIAYTGPSSAWAVVADRFSELAVVGHGGDVDLPQVEGLNFADLDRALHIAAGPYRGALPSDVEELYKRNYRGQDRER